MTLIKICLQLIFLIFRQQGNHGGRRKEGFTAILEESQLRWCGYSLADVSPPGGMDDPYNGVKNLQGGGVDIRGALLDILCGS